MLPALVSPPLELYKSVKQKLSLGKNENKTKETRLGETNQDFPAFNFAK